MKSFRALLVLAVAGLTLLALPLIAGAQVPNANQATSTFQYTKNMKPLGYSARVVETQDGQRTLEVRVDKNEARGYQEVWLIAPDLSRLVSLGVMTSESGTFSVPAGLDLGEYPIVDVSDEPVDGDPAHSSVSIVRGTLAS